MPRGTSLLYTVRSLGSTIGVSLGGSVQVGALVGALNSRFAGIPGAPAIVEAIVHSKGVIRTLPPEQQVLALDAYAISLSSVWYACAGVAVLTLLSAMGIRQNAIPHKDQRETRRNGVEEER
jgi:hypothetical protein